MAISRDLEKMTLNSGPLYVCEVTGNDETGTGAESAPFQSVNRAYEVAAAVDESNLARILVRKALEGEGAGFAEASQASLKKAKKNLENLKKKAQKEEERKRKEAETSAQKAKEEAARLELAKSIVLHQDPSWPKAVPVRSP